MNLTLLMNEEFSGGFLCHRVNLGKRERMVWMERMEKRYLLMLCFTFRYFTCLF